MAVRWDVGVRKGRKASMSREDGGLVLNGMASIGATAGTKSAPERDMWKRIATHAQGGKKNRPVTTDIGTTMKHW